MKGLSDTYVESVIRAFAKGRMNVRQGTLAARGQRRISGVPENAKVNHSLLKIGNKIAIFSGNKKFKSLFAPYFAETETRPLQKSKERRINGLSIKMPSRFFSHQMADFATREAGEIGYCLILVFKNRAPLFGPGFRKWG